MVQGKGNPHFRKILVRYDPRVFLKNPYYLELVGDSVQIRPDPIPRLKSGGIGASHQNGNTALVPSELIVLFLQHPPFRYPQLEMLRGSLVQTVYLWGKTTGPFSVLDRYSQ